MYSERCPYRGVLLQRVIAILIGMIIFKRTATWLLGEGKGPR